MCVLYQPYQWRPAILIIGDAANVALESNTGRQKRHHVNRGVV